MNNETVTITITAKTLPTPEFLASLTEQVSKVAGNRKLTLMVYET